MPKLPAITPKKLVSFLKKQGFFIDRQSGSHMILIHSDKQRRVVVPIHTKDVPKGTLLSILKMAGFEKEDLMK